MSMRRMALKSGDIVAFTYRVERTLGVGAMGLVVAATHLFTGVPVAIKCLLPQHADNVSLVRRFEREARVAARFRSENAVRVLHFGVLDQVDPDATIDAEDPGALAPGLPYIVMERLDGMDLASLLRERGPLDPYTAADYIAQACGALAEAHALCLIHRDIKLANLFLTQTEATELVKVIDFGIAKFTSPNAAGDAHRLTSDESMLGTLSYMSPEQMADCTSVDARSDIWSLGVTLYRLITGVAPFQGETPVDVALSVAHERPPPPSALRSGVPAGLDAVVQRCLEKRREDRYPSATALRLTLAPFVSRFSRSAAQSCPATVRLARYADQAQA